jgi:hypothetical protein
MSTQEDLNWDDVLGGIDAAEEKAKKEGKSTSDFDALPPGPYQVVVQESDKMVASTGKDMIKVKVQVTEGPYVNRTLFNYFVFGSKEDVTLNRITLDNLGAFGITRDYIGTQKPSIAEIAESLVGLSAMATVGIQEKGEYKGRNEIKRFKALAGAQPAAPVAKEATKPGVPDVPKPDVAPAASAPTPDIPTPDVPTGDGDAADPFE